jgi:hypothetical protein
VFLKIWLHFSLRAVGQKLERRFIVSLKIWLYFFLRQAEIVQDIRHMYVMRPS